MKKILLIMVFGILFSMFSFTDETKKIGVLIQRENTATYDDTFKGLLNFLKTKNMDILMDVRNAKNDKDMMKKITEEFQSNPNIEVIAVIGSSSAPLVSEIVKEKPVVFGGTNHPDGVGIIKRPNITGTTYYVAPKALLSLIKQINPLIKKIGILYEPPEQLAVSKVEVPEIEKAAKELNILTFKESIITGNDLPSKTQKLIDKGVQLIIIPNNAVVYNDLAKIRALTDGKKIPLTSLSFEAVKNGAVYGLMSDKIKLGEDMGQMVYDIISKKKNVSDIAYKFPAPKDYKIVINMKAKSELKVNIPINIIKIAEIIK